MLESAGVVKYLGDRDNLNTAERNIEVRSIEVRITAERNIAGRNIEERLEKER
jgi:hypothetical protein